MRPKHLFQLTLALSLCSSTMAVDSPKVQIKPVPGPAKKIQPVPRPAPGARPLPGRLPGRFPGQPAKPQLVQWGEKQIVAIATITDIRQGPTAKSFPPIYNHALTMKIEDVLRGDIKAGNELTANHSARQQQKPVYPEGKIIVALSNVRGSLRVEAFEEANNKNLDSIRLACELPIGWKSVNGKVISPWASLEARAWPKAQKIGAKHFCSVTGRPALMAGADLSYSVEKVPPSKEIKWTNPDGDGQYKITVTNSAAKPIKIDALRQQGKRILWKESLVILCQGKSYSIPGSAGLSRPTEPVLLRPGQSVSTVINALGLEGPSWPKGGYRIEFQFCLGERSSKQSFYYLSRHHDGIRSGLKKKVK